MSADGPYRFTAVLWRHDGPAGWHFVTLPPEIADDVRARTEGRPRPFGVIRAEVRLGDVSWSTSLFADRASDSFLLPVKADVRRRAGVADGDRVRLEVELRLDG